MLTPIDEKIIITEKQPITTILSSDESLYSSIDFSFSS